MIHKNYSVYTAQKDLFENMCKDVLVQIKDENILKIVFFGSPADNHEYLSQLHQLEQCCRAHFLDKTPLISYVSQTPFYGDLKAEVMSAHIPSDCNVIKTVDYVVLETLEDRELLTGGLCAESIFDSIEQQSQQVFSRLEAILKETQFNINDIVRQWNYIVRIVDFDGDQQHYQAFNDARTHFYAQTNWHGGYPAATGIGTQFGGILLEVIAFQGEEIINLPLDNPWQVAAHNYSQSVLLGEPDQELKHRTTPKFERARVVGVKKDQTIYISGTAAIRGEQSVLSTDVIEQTRLTMENIEFLVSEKNYLNSVGVERKYDLLRVYMKNPEDSPRVREFLNKEYPGIKKFFVHADVCREELLIEIEGIVTLC